MAGSQQEGVVDLTADSITPRVIRLSSDSGDPRLTHLLSRLVSHLHDFARETRLPTDEWQTALDFLAACGRIGDDKRHVRAPARPVQGAQPAKLTTASEGK